MNQFAEVENAKVSIETLFRRFLYAMIFSCICLQRPGECTFRDPSYGVYNRIGNIFYPRVPLFALNEDSFYSYYDNYWGVSFNANIDPLEDWELLPIKNPICPPYLLSDDMIEVEEIKIKRDTSLRAA